MIDPVRAVVWGTFFIMVPLTWLSLYMLITN